jgi:hypothetical protein
METKNVQHANYSSVQQQRMKAWNIFTQKKVAFINV